MAIELTNAEFAAHMRRMADMLDGPENAWSKILPGILRTLRKGADIIEALTAESAEKDRLLLEITAKYETAVRIQGMITGLQKLAEVDLARVTEERDAAVKDSDELIKLYCKDESGIACDFCADNGEECHGDDPRWHCQTIEGREWRGPKEAEAAMEGRDENS